MSQTDTVHFKTDPVFRDRLKRENVELLIARTKFALTVAFFVYPGFWFLDKLESPDYAGLFFYFRLGVVVVYALGYMLLSGFLAKKFAVIVSVTVVFASAFGIAIMIPYIGGFQSSYYIGILMAIVVAGLFFPWSVPTTIICCALIVSSYFGVNFILAPETIQGAASLALPFFFLTGTSVFTVFANYGKQRSHIRDLTQRLAIEKANRELKKLDEAKTRFFSNVSHELRSPLMLILGPLEAMQQDRGRDDAPKLLDAMEANARRLLRQVNTLLDFAKMDVDKLECKLVPGNIGILLDDLGKAARPHAETSGVALLTEGLEEVPDTRIDIEKMETVGANLISNAVKFTPKGGTITLRAGSNQQKIWFEVQDTGPGIPEDQIESIFERFLQAENTLSFKMTGTGLGLAMVKELVKLHKGIVTVDSTVGKGSTFRVELPRDPDIKPVDRRQRIGRRKEDIMAAEQTEQRLGMHFEQRPDTRTLLSDIPAARLASDQDDINSNFRQEAPHNAPTVLVVDDNDDLRTFVARSLAKNYRIMQGRDGQEGIEVARKIVPDIIISDVRMPRMDGYKFCKAVREDSTLEQLPFILVTSKSGTEAVIEGLDVGANDYVAKPFEMRELEARISAHLRSRRLEKNLHERESRLSAIGKMTSSIVHDLRNPLNAIVGFAEIAQLDATEGGNQNVSEMLDPVINEARRVEDMINEVLDYARGHAANIKPELVNLKEYIIANTGHLKSRLEATNIELIINHHEDESASFRIDPEKTLRILENLVRNSQEALNAETGQKDKKVWISTTATDNEVVLRIADNGPGISQSIFENIFEPFTTVGKSTGTGLGLATVRNLVIAQGGEIQAEQNAKEGGAAFIIRFMNKKQN